MRKSDAQQKLDRNDEIERIYRNALKELDKSEPQRTIEKIRLKAWREVSLDHALGSDPQCDIGAEISAKQTTMLLESVLHKTARLETRQKLALSLLVILLVTLWLG
ncbi:hypothetical protein [uncultured Shimia sp.]|uniref:hypothetical protein n=1 Tax=uncultured Shimia sp. TaxID=573152 RepID=UPI00262068A5|nr:hypothetical protein [uncultured Shimia sp.]